MVISKCFMSAVMLCCITTSAFADEALWIKHARAANAAYEKHDAIAEKTNYEAAINELLKLPPNSVSDPESQLLMEKLSLISERSEPSSAPETEAECNRRIVRLRRKIAVEQRMKKADTEAKNSLADEVAAWNHEIAMYEKTKIRLKNK